MWNPVRLLVLTLIAISFDYSTVSGCATERAATDDMALHFMCARPDGHVTCETSCSDENIQGNFVFFYRHICLRQSINASTCIRGTQSPHSSCLYPSISFIRSPNYNKDAVMARVNQIRRSRQQRNLEWDWHLARTAARWAAQCQWAYDQPPTRVIPTRNWTEITASRFGSSSQLTTITAAIEQWDDDGPGWSDFDHLVETDITHIGCGAALCREVTGNPKTMALVFCYFAKDRSNIEVMVIDDS